MAKKMLNDKLTIGALVNKIKMGKQVTFLDNR